MTGVFWSVVSVGGLAETWRILPAAPLKETASVPSPLALTVIVPEYPSSVATFEDSSGPAPAVRMPLHGPRLTVSFVAVIDTEPVKFGAVLGPLPPIATEGAVMV